MKQFYNIIINSEKKRGDFWQVKHKQQKGTTRTKKSKINNIKSSMMGSVAG